MTKVLLRALPQPSPRVKRVLDFCCGSGVIAASILSRSPSVEMHVLDADAVALKAVKKNVPGAVQHCADGQSR